MKTTILNSDSIVQKIWNSHIFTAWFERHCNEMEGHGKVKNLRAAKHRFESFSKPLGRVILWLPALLATANDIAVKREGAPEGQEAQAWLNGITSETLLTLAMLADPGDEWLALVRQVDDEHTDIACLQRIVADFLDHARFLWQDGGCFSSDGYTKHCHGLLADGLPVVVVRGAHRADAKVLRKPGGATLDRCLQRMRCWLRLAEETLQAEFPHCHLLRAFSVFDVADAAEGHDWGPAHSPGLHRLAAALNVDGGALCAEIADHRPIAAAIAKETGCDNRRAWQKAVERTQATTASREVHPASALVRVLQRYFAWTCSSSGVEQSFSVAERLRFGRGPASEATEALQLRAALDKRPDEAAQVCARAREMYAAVFGVRRGQRTRSRLDKGRHKKQQRTDTEAAWLRRRRLSVAVASAAARKRKAEPSSNAAGDDGHRPAGWTERHEKEMNAQRRKAKQREEEAAREGHLELTPELAAAVDQQILKDLKADENMAKKARRQKVAAGIMRRTLSWDVLRGRRVWVNGADDTHGKVLESLTRQGMVVTQDRCQAEVFAVDDVGKPGERVTWLVTLRGSLLVSFQQVLTSKGLFFQFLPAVNVKREIFFSPRFIRDHSEVTRMIQLATSWSNSLWKHLVTEGDFRKRCLTKSAKQFVCVLACTSELANRWPAGIKVFDKKSFLHAITRYDLSKSGGGQRHQITRDQCQSLEP